MPKTSAPSRLTIRSYQVGFGDCYLLSFAYPDGERHVLIDFGSSARPKKSAPSLMRQVAEDIRSRCGGRLDAVVASHRHSDHISGFATAGGGAKPLPGDVIRGCRPRVVVQPWTEDPDAARDAVKATAVLRRRKAFVAGLASMQDFAGWVAAESGSLVGRIGKRLAAHLAFVGEQNIKNESAVRNLMTMAVETQAYVHFGSRSGLEKILPGVKVHVLGPPTLEQTETIREQRDVDDAEFWHLQALGARAFARPDRGPFPRAAGYAAKAEPAHARWLKRRMAGIRGEALRELVRALDEALNNTSVILLFEAGGKKFLFPGDAQLENWSHALSRPEVRSLLRDVLVYKVGHHGSLNATPKSLWALLRNRSKGPKATRLRTLLSTMPGKHGSGAKGTEVPRKKLVDALKAETDLFTTQSLRGKTLWKDFRLEL